MSKEVIFLIPSMSGGGAERVISIISSYLAEKGMKVVISLFKNDIIEYSISDKVIIDTTLIGKCNNVTGKLINFRKYLAKHYNATIISFFTMIGIYILLLSLGLKNKVIISERLDPAKSIPSNKILFFIRRLLYKTADRFVFQTPDALAFFEEKIQNKGIIIPNPLKEHLPSRYTGKRSKRVVTFARLEPQKNYTLLINAFEVFLRKYPDYILDIYGKGREEEKLVSLVKEKNLSNKINFKGFSKDVHTAIYDARMFVLPSDYEGLSNSMLEAMAIGLPCICTDCPPGGARMFIEDGENGLLVPVGDINAMANAMAKLADDPNLAEKISIKATEVRSELNVEKICKQWENIINS